jgi:hypothetical protein
MAKAASHRLLYQIRPRLVAFADPFLISEDDMIRELSAKVFLTMWKRLNDPVYIQQIIDVSFL